MDKIQNKKQIKIYINKNVRKKIRNISKDKSFNKINDSYDKITNSRNEINKKDTSKNKFKYYTEANNSFNLDESQDNKKNEKNTNYRKENNFIFNDNLKYKNRIKNPKKYFEELD